MQGDEKHPKAPVHRNSRPTMPLFQRAIRTNINSPETVAVTLLFS